MGFYSNEILLKLRFFLILYPSQLIEVTRVGKKNKGTQ